MKSYRVMSLVRVKNEIAEKWWNRGHCAEYAVGQYFGIEARPNSISHKAYGDVNGIQVKSANGRAATGTYDIEQYLADDAATSFAYVAENNIAYEMSRVEWIEFVKLFTVPTTNKNEKYLKLSETRAMRDWLYIKEMGLE